MERMRAVVIREPGGPEVLEIREVPLPEPGPGQVRVRVAAFGLNRADLLQRRGRYPVPEGYPAEIPGLEYSGVVDAVGPEVDGSWAGRRVMGITGGGAYAEYVVEPLETLLPVPEGMDLVAAAAVPEAFITAFDALVLQAGMGRGEVVLIHAVGSGVGTAAVQLVHRRGARALGTSRTPAKLERALRLGLDVPILGDEHWPERVLEHTGGHGADVILDLVGAPYLPGNQRVTALRGRHMVVGVPGGPRGEIDLRLLMSRRARIQGTVLRARPLREKAQVCRAFAEEVLPDLRRGLLVPVVDRVMPAERVREAQELMERNETFGKVVLTW